MTIRKITVLAAMAALIFLSGKNGIASEDPSIAVIPLRLNAPAGMDYLKGAYRDMLSSRIAADGNLQVADPAGLQDFFDKYGLSASSDETKRSLAKGMEVGFVLEGSLSIIGDDLSLDVRLVTVDGWNISSLAYKGKGMGAFTEMVEKLASDVRSAVSPKKKTEEIKTSGKKDAASGVRDEVRAGRVKMWKSQRLPVVLKEIAVSDLDNDGALEVAAIDDKNLYIYAFDKDGLKLKKEIKGKQQYRNYSMSIGDFNGNGLQEIYLTGKYMDRASTRILEFVNNDFEVIADELSWFVRVINRPDKALLIGEKYRDIDGLYGGVKLLKWRDKGLEEDGLLKMPKMTGFYGFTLFDVTGDGSEDFLYLDDSDRLRLYEKDEGGEWKQTWKSYKYYGGSLNKIEFGPALPEKEAIIVKPKILIGRLREDGRYELIINSNEPGGTGRIFKNLLSYESGDVKGLLWDDTGLEEIWHTKKVSGYIADFTMADLNKDGTDEPVMLMVTKLSSAFSSGESQIITLSPENNPSSR